MSTVSITGRLKENKTAEFYLTIETMKNLIEKNCLEFQYDVSKENDLKIKISFEDSESLKNFDKLEFSILKGSIRSLCKDVEINTHSKMD